MNIISGFIFNPAFAALALLTVLVIVMIFMPGKMNRYLCALIEQNSNGSKVIEDALFDSCDDTGEKIEAMNVSVSGQVQAMKKEILKELSAAA